MKEIVVVVIGASPVIFESLSCRDYWNGKGVQYRPVFEVKIVLIGTVQKSRIIWKIIRYKLYRKIYTFVESNPFLSFFHIKS